MKSFILKRLREPSTWAGIVALAAGLGGFQLDEEQRQAVVQLGLAIAGVLFVFTREQTKTGEQITEAIGQVVKPADPVITQPITAAPQANPGPTPVPKQRPIRGSVLRSNRSPR